MLRNKSPNKLFAKRFMKKCKKFAMLFVASAAFIASLNAMAESLYEQQRLERSARERTFDLQLRSDTQRRGITDPVQDQRARDQTYNQKLRLEQLLQRQKQQLRQADTQTEQHIEQQQLQRQQSEQDLDFKIEREITPDP